MNYVPKKFGFSLIEVVIYIALFSILFSTVIVGVYQLMSSASKLGTASDQQTEALFIIQKLSWLGADVECSYDGSARTLSCGSGMEPVGVLSDNVSNFNLIRTSTTTAVEFSIGSTTYQQTIYKNI